MRTMSLGGTPSPTYRAKTTSSPSLLHKCLLALQATILSQRKRILWCGSRQVRSHNTGAQNQEAGVPVGHLHSLESRRGETSLCLANRSRGTLVRASRLYRTIRSLGCRTCRAQAPMPGQRRVELQDQMTAHSCRASTRTAKDLILSSSACSREM